METRQRTADARQPVMVQLFGGPTALIEIDDLRLLTGTALPARRPGSGGTRTSLPDAHSAHTAVRAARAAEILGARTVIPVDPEGWERCAEGLHTRVTSRRGLRERLLLLGPGRSSVV
ncbi:hypothetical protein ACFRCW_22650 [Streptomyces sp. NPDC056653]|uniref:hypothetical protein n=1 Tax=Streptomyces sp. NPDC056653 TaxID=3345894 RepID=UPI00368B4E22